MFKRSTSGNWILRYRNVDGTTVQESSGTGDENLAKTMLRQKMARIELGEYVQPKTQNVTVKELYESFLKTAQMKHYRDIKSIEYRWKHLQPVFGKLKAIHVTKDRLTDYVVKRQQEGAADPTINRELSVIRRTFHLNEEKISKMPKFPMLKENNARQGFLEDEQYQKLAEKCNKAGLWLRAMFEVAYCFGWRSGGLKKMKVSQVDLFNCTLHLTADQSKNGEEVTVPIVKSDPLYRLLAACVSGKQQTDYLFSRENPQKPIKDFRQSWNLVCTAAGFPELLFHDLRRTAVSNMEAEGIPRSVAMSITGHKTEAVYQRYDMNKHRKGAQAAAVKAIFARRNCSLTAVNASQSEGHQGASESTDRIEKTV